MLRTRQQINVDKLYRQINSIAFKQFNIKSPESRYVGAILNNDLFELMKARDDEYYSKKKNIISYKEICMMVELWPTYSEKNIERIGLIIKPL